MTEHSQIKSAGLRASMRSLVKSNCERGFTLETLSAMAEALQEGIANYAANAHLPHAQSTDTLMRAVVHLLNDPVNEPYISEKLELGAQLAHDEFALLTHTLEEPEPVPKQKSKHPHLQIVLKDGQLAPA